MHGSQHDGKPDRKESDSHAVTELVEPAFTGQKMFISLECLVSTNTEPVLFPCIKWKCKGQNVMVKNGFKQYFMASKG